MSNFNLRLGDNAKVFKYGQWYACRIVRATPTKYVVQFTQKSGRLVERTVPKEDVK